MKIAKSTKDKYRSLRSDCTNLHLWSYLRLLFVSFASDYPHFYPSIIFVYLFGNLPDLLSENCE